MSSCPSRTFHRTVNCVLTVCVSRGGKRSGKLSHAQIAAFEDTWEWGDEAEETYHDTIQQAGKLADFLQAFRAILGTSDMMAYLVMMAPRLKELHRVLKPTGSVYLHCDPTASHYLKLLMDAIFDARNYRNEIIWKRTTAHSDTKQGLARYGRIHDVLLYYGKGSTATFNTEFVPYSQDYIDSHYRFLDPGSGRRFRKGDLTASRPGGDTEYEWRVKRNEGERWSADLTDEFLNPRPEVEYRGVTPYKGRYWAYSRQNMTEFEKQARLHYTESGMPEYKRFLDEMPGVPVQSLWDDILPINSQAQERLHYPTQKPEALLQRIISVSSNEGDVVLDPFCGCGTSISVAERLHRKWIGIDITHLAITLIRSRLFDHFKSELSPYEVVGDPKDLESAKALALESEHDGRYQFQFWAAGLVDAFPAGGQKKKGADSGIDGVINFLDDNSGQAKKIVVQVKSGHVKAGDIRDLKGVLDREKAAMGCFVTLEEPSGPMKTEAVSAGFYQSGLKLQGVASEKYPKIQILTIKELLAGKKLEFPRHKMATFKQAERKSKSKVAQSGLFDSAEEPF